MSVRAWLYRTLMDYPPLSAMLDTRVYQGGSLTSAQTVKPFLVYRFGNDTNEGLGGEALTDPQPHRSFFQVYIHDSPGDYDQIDTIIELVKAAFREASMSPENKIIAIRFLETSRDLDDPLLGSFFRYCRFQLVIT